MRSRLQTTRERAQSAADGEFRTDARAFNRRSRAAERLSTDLLRRLSGPPPSGPAPRALVGETAGKRQDARRRVVFTSLINTLPMRGARRSGSTGIIAQPVGSTTLAVLCCSRSRGGSAERRSTGRPVSNGHRTNVKKTLRLSSAARERDGPLAPYCVWRVVIARSSSSRVSAAFAKRSVPTSWA